MGASTFMTFAAGSDAGTAFRAAKEQASYEHGHGGYTGTIAEKSGYRIVPRQPGQDGLTLPQARKLATTLIDTEAYWDKWGPAGAIFCTRTYRIDDPGPDFVEAGWLFFGWASD